MINTSRLNPNQNIEQLYSKLANHIDQARQGVQRTVDTEMLRAYWLIGRDIVEAEQRGEARAKYGDNLILLLSKRLIEGFGRGFSVANLRNMRKFYIIYQNVNIGHPIRYPLRSELKGPIRQTVSVELSVSIPKSEAISFKSNLGWGHYRILMRIKRAESRSFYEIEASKNCWSMRELQRQIDSFLFDRLAKSRDKAGVMALALKGQEIIRPQDLIKEPLVLEFLGIPEAHQLVESKLEEALINNLNHFLLELGKGFAFMARQKRLSLDGDHFYADLVFYHVVLKCYVIIDIKTKKLTHADLGQMQLYVNYFDQEIKLEDDNPSIGLVLCTDKSDAVVKYTLGEKAKQIFTSEYQFHLPSEQELEAELRRELERLAGYRLS